MKRFLYSALGFLVWSALIVPSASAATREVRIIGRKEVTVTTPSVSIGDIARVQSHSPGNDEALIALKRIRVAAAPPPGEKTTITASSVLDALRSHGVDLQVVGYQFPRVISVQRAGRPVLESELRAVIEQILSDSKRDIAVKHIEFEDGLSVAPGTIEMTATSFETQRPGKLGFSFEVSGEDQSLQRFDAYALIDEWRQIPVATRAIQRGSLVDVNDIKMARYNVSALPGDVALEPDAIYGHAAERNISYGDVFRKTHLSIPPVIEMGTAVTLLYRKGVLEATASGVAIESGAIGDEIRVRNEASRKILMGKVLEPGLVGVGK